MMTATVLTAETLIRRYADDLAYVTQQPPATDLAALISQLDTAAPRYEAAGINGHEDLETASSHLDEALNSTDETSRTQPAGTDHSTWGSAKVKQNRYQSIF